jgi:hypothetical protein
LDLTRPERALLQRLAQVGGRYTFKPDGESVIALRAFEEGIVAVLLSLYEKQLVHIASGGTAVASVPGQPVRFTEITAELTDAGREAIR